MTADTALPLSRDFQAFDDRDAGAVTDDEPRVRGGLKSTDPLFYGGVVVTLLAVAVTAAVVPARRAVRLDSSEALRAD